MKEIRQIFKVVENQEQGKVLTLRNAYYKYNAYNSFNLIKNESYLIIGEIITKESFDKYSLPIIEIINYEKLT